MTQTKQNKPTQDLIDWLEFLIDSYIEDDDDNFFQEVQAIYEDIDTLDKFAGNFCKKYRNETEAYPFPTNLRGVDWAACGEFIESKIRDRI